MRVPSLPMTTTPDATLQIVEPRFSRLRPAALAAVIANVGIVLTGGVVRVTGSGLGCPDWPTCSGTSVIPSSDAPEAGWHQAIEFGNRTLTGVLLAIAIWVVVAHRRDIAELADEGTDAIRARLARLVWAQPVGIVFQAVLGGVTVLTDLNPIVVAVHFLISMMLIAAAVALRDSVREDHPAPSVLPDGRITTQLLRTATIVVTSVAAVVLLIGTVVTAAGPHAGDPGTPRLGVSIRSAALVHADAVWLLLGLTLALVLVSRALGDANVARAATILLAVELAQGGVGYTQYALGIPPALVSLHLLGASLVWVAAVRLVLVTREHDRAPELPVVKPPTAQRSHVTVTASGS